MHDPENPSATSFEIIHPWLYQLLTDTDRMAKKTILSRKDTEVNTMNIIRTTNALVTRVAPAAVFPGAKSEADSACSAI